LQRGVPEAGVVELVVVLGVVDGGDGVVEGTLAGALAVDPVLWDAVTVVVLALPHAESPRTVSTAAAWVLMR
jgi:hypothetical protein